MYRIPNEQVAQSVKLTNYSEALPVTILSTCPYCTNKPVPFAIKWYVARTGDNSVFVQSHISGTSQCGVCRKNIFVLHVSAQNNSTTNISSGIYILPEPPVGKGFTERLSKASPGFVEIYHQAAKAEATGLDEVAGPGYRKALEFLIKDYLLSVAEEGEREKLKRTMLGPCIKDHIKDDEIKAAADAAKVVGNSETHYVRDEVATLEDLKKFIDLTVYWLEKKLATEDLIAKAKLKDEQGKTKKKPEASG